MKRPKQLKDYIYISATKVDMLFAQIEEPMLKNITASLGLDFKLIKVNVSGAVGRQHEHRVQRLEAVLAYMEKSGGFGTIDDPEPPYIKEPNLNMKWGKIEGRNAALFFAGSTDRTIVGLGGSPEHLSGQTGSATTSASQSPILLEALRPVVAHDERPARRMPALDDDSLYVVEDAVRDMTGPREPLEFVAKRLLFGRTKRIENGREIERQVLLATPLYIARR